MRTLFIVALLPLAPAMAQQAPRTSLPAKCKPTAGLVEYKPDGATRPRPLADMPQAVEIKTLWRVVDGCPQPIVVRRGLGNPSATPSPAPDAKPKTRTLR